MQHTDLGRNLEILKIILDKELQKSYCNDTHTHDFFFQIKLRLFDFTHKSTQTTTHSTATIANAIHGSLFVCDHWRHRACQLRASQIDAAISRYRDWHAMNGDGWFHCILLHQNNNFIIIRFHFQTFDGGMRLALNVRRCTSANRANIGTRRRHSPLRLDVARLTI